jgi:hypothetical protein
MPNIIEQQDLLKGLPDARLMKLAQNPTGEIPSFLVSAEMLRRKQIREQYAAPGSKESVVDTLIKQLANVPQNVNAPARTPPTIPQTPQMQGVMALQQQQAMTDIAQQAQPQTMRSGGMVQRYQGAGVVMPLQQRIQSIMEQFGVDENGAAEMIRNNPSIGSPKIEGDLGKPFYVPETNQEPAASPLELNIPILTTSPEEFAKRQRELMRERKYQEMENYPGYPGDMSAFKPAPVKRAEEEERMRDSNADRRRLADQKSQATPSAGAPPPEPGETPDEYRARLEKILAAQQPSDWEKAQGYFAMAEQFLDPSKTTMQSLVGAGQAFAQSAAERDRAQREAKLALERGLLEYDMGKAQSRSEAAAEEAKDKREFEQRMQERGTPTADAAISAITRTMIEIEGQIQKLSEGLGPGLPPPPENKAEIERLLRVKKGLNNQMITIMDRGGFINKKIITDEDLAALGIM